MIMVRPLSNSRRLQVQGTTHINTDGGQDRALNNLLNPRHLVRVIRVQLDKEECIGGIKWIQTPITSQINNGRIMLLTKNKLLMNLQLQVIQVQPNYREYKWSMKWIQEILMTNIERNVRMLLLVSKYFVDLETIKTMVTYTCMIMDKTCMI